MSVQGFRFQDWSRLLSFTATLKYVNTGVVLILILLKFLIILCRVLCDVGYII
jgi:hypothetical protein